MLFPRALLIAALAISFVGCGKDEPVKPAPLSLAEWQKMPFAKKYETDTLERLKLGDPKFGSDVAWDEFTRRVILPNRKKDNSLNKRR